MALSVNPAFATLLNAATTSNNAWSAAFKNGLGTSRRVICKIAPAGTAQANVYNIGTKFRDAAITGEMVISGGIVSSYGTTSNLTTSTAADLAAGVAVLRIEGNGNWIEGTLGLVGSGADFVVPVNPTATNSIAVTPNLRIKPPPFLPSGNGYTPPVLGSDAPAYAIIEDWRNPQNVVEAGRILFNQRMENWSFTDTEIAQGMGDIRVTGSTNIVTFTDIEFGALLFSMNAEANSEASRAVHQVVVAMKPTSGPGQNWPDYPRLSGYKVGTRTGTSAGAYGLSNTFPGAFKVRICQADSTTLGIIEMDKDKLAINSDELLDYPTKTKAARPHMNTGQMLVWNSHKPKMSTFSKKWFPGMDMRVVRPSMSKKSWNYAGAAPMHIIGSDLYGVQNWFATGKWANAISVEAVQADRSLDPYLYPINGEPAPSDGVFKTPPWAVVHGTPQEEHGFLNYGAARLMGWGYEPGGVGVHDQVTAPGGTRIDRGVWAGPQMIALTDPNWVHLRDNTKISEMIEHWNKHYFNHGCHYFTDVRTFASLPPQEFLEGKWSHSKTWYGGLSSYTAGGTAYAIPQYMLNLNSVSNNNTAAHGGLPTDANFRMLWNGYAVDGLHDYQTPGDVAMHYNSPAHALSTKHRYMTHLMTGLGDSEPDLHAAFYFGSRSHAWRMLQHSTMWKLASDHPTLGITRAQVESRLIIELTRLYNDYYVPMYVQNSQDPHMLVLKRFGVPYTWRGDKWGAGSFGMTFYMAGVMVKMRQFGLFKKLWNMGEVTQKALLTIIRLLDAGSIQYFTQTRGSYMQSGYAWIFNGEPHMVMDETVYPNPEVPLSWGDWRDRKFPLKGQEDWIHLPDGTLNAVNDSEHMRGGWPQYRLDYFRDIPCEYSWTEVQEAADIVESFHQEYEDHINALAAGGASARTLAGEDWYIPVPSARLQHPNPADVEAL